MTAIKTTEGSGNSEVKIVSRADVVVVGGGPAGVSAAVAAARSGASVTLVERYPYLGGLASGGMVLVLDDMINGPEITVRGLCHEMIERLERLGLAVYPPSPSEATTRQCFGNGTAGAHSIFT